MTSQPGDDPREVTLAAARLRAVIAAEEAKA